VGLAHAHGPFEKHVALGAKAGADPEELFLPAYELEGKTHE
jgi:hypothetical protein